MRSYGWNNAFTNKALVGYRQFIKLKLQHEDYDAEILSPSLTVDLVWHQHILDVKLYAKACKDYCGELIGHDPDGGLDQSARAERIKATKNSLIALFGRQILKEEVWTFGTENDGIDNENETTTSNNNKRRRVQNNSNSHSSSSSSATAVQEPRRVPDDDHTASSSSAATSIVVDSKIMLRVVYEYYGQETFFRIKLKQPMGRIFDVFAQRLGVQATDLRFLIHGQRIEPSQTPYEVSLDDQDTIDVMWEQFAC